MRRLVIVGSLAGVACLVLWARRAKLHERLMARCEAMFDRMPDTFPPKRAMRSVEEIRANTARVVDMLEASKRTAERGI